MVFSVFWEQERIAKFPSRRWFLIFERKAGGRIISFPCSIGYLCRANRAPHNIYKIRTQNLYCGRWRAAWRVLCVYSTSSSSCACEARVAYIVSLSVCVCGTDRRMLPGDTIRYDQVAWRKFDLYSLKVVSYTLVCNRNQSTRPQWHWGVE